METCVLIPQEFSLAYTPLKSTNDMDVTVWTNREIKKGTIFYPFQGTLRVDKLKTFNQIGAEDVRCRFGLYDEVSYTCGKHVRHCNWVRFLRATDTFGSQVNVICSKVNGEPIFEVIKSITTHQELVVHFLPEKPEELFFKRMRTSLFRQTMDCILEGSPLDFSTSLLNTVVIPNSPSSCSEDEHKSISGDSLGSISSFIDSTSDQIISCNESTYRDHIDHCKGSNNKSMSQKWNRCGRSERSLLPCEICSKAFDRPSLLKRHMRTHTGEKPHICLVCGKGFSTSSSLNTHRRIHSGEKPHQCPVCGKRFTASSNLYYHRMTHVKEKPHKCNLCAKSFPTPGDLRSHMYVHSGSWPFKCHICSRGFSKHTNLKNHLFLHTGDRPHGCELCSKKFALACNLRAHMKTHEGDPQDECVRCGSIFVAASNNLQHGLCAKCSTSNGCGINGAVHTGFHLERETTTDDSSNCETAYSDK